MASARLRKTFKYPSDDEDSGGASRDEMDEEGQYFFYILLHMVSMLTTATQNRRMSSCRFKRNLQHQIKHMLWSSRLCHFY